MHRSTHHFTTYGNMTQHSKIKKCVSYSSSANLGKNHILGLLFLSLSFAEAGVSGIEAICAFQDLSS